MDTSDKGIDFNQMITEIEKEMILLPDFQRKFRWTDREIQAKLAASVLCKMPIGSILLLELPANEYMARKIGSNSSENFIQLETEEKRQFLLDGQQRVTVVANVFSDLIHENGMTQIDSLKRRFFLGIPKPSNQEEYGWNDWGLEKLHFPMTNPSREMPKYMTEEIAQNIIIKDFVKNDRFPFNPYQKYEGEGLVSYCTGEEGYYLIPLYLLVKREDKRVCQRNRRLLQNVLSAIATEQGRYILEHYDTPSTRGEWFRQRFANGQSELETDADTDVKIEIMMKTETESETFENDEKFEKEIIGLQGDWARDMEEYLYSCISEMNLHIMGVPNASREKAIEVFENLNRGGVRLSTFDLVMARAARDNRNFTEALERECSCDRNYPEQCIPNRIKSFCKKYMAKKRAEKGLYNALSDTECINENTGDLTKIFQDAFLNVLSLKCHDQENVNMVHRNYRKEISKNSILQLSSSEINYNYQLCCEALDRAAFFLKVRCGIRKISEVNYQLMFTVLGYLFLEKEVYERNKVWDLLTAWYWCAIFAGRYDKDQNIQADRDINALLHIIHTNENVEYIREMQQNALMVPYFSEQKFLLFENGAESGIFPKDVLAQYFCQFYLAEGYDDLFRDDLFLCTFSTEHGADELEKHHIIPLMSDQAKTIGGSEKVLKQEGKKRNIVNSPLNRIYITKQSNKDIAAKDFDSYLKYIRGAAVDALGLPSLSQNLESYNVRDILADRHVRIRNRFENRMNEYLRDWQDVH